jgi:hypothetical protein
LAVYNGELYSGGGALVRKWNPSVSTWYTVAGTPLSVITSMAVYNNELYISGDFSLGNYSIAKWNGSAWSGLGAYGFYINTWAQAMTPFLGVLYVGGNFPIAGGINSQGLAKWNGTNWFAGVPGNTINYYVGAIAATTTAPYIVYVGGNFDTPYPHIMKYTSLVGIDEPAFPEGAVSIYPSPAHSELTIHIQQEIKNPLVKIYNSAGAIVYSAFAEPGKETILTEDYAAGLYYVKVSDGEKAFTQKLVIE